MVLIEEDLNARFEKAIFNLLLSFNYIDVNVGLLISHAPPMGHYEERYKKLAKMSFDQRMRWFKSLLKTDEVRDHLKENGVAAFESWHGTALEAKELRNRYVHGIWRFLPMRRGSPVSISSPAWMKDVFGGELEVALSLDELEAKAAQVEKVFKEFCRLRKKYNV
jgi:hypothetical protein